MIKKSKSTKQVRAIDRIIKFQIDDGIESLTISGKEALADVSIDSKANVTLYLNADKDKINDIQSLVPFVTVKTTTGGTETDKTKTVTLSQDLTQFALEIADNSKELARLIKTQSSIKLDLGGLVQKLLDIAGKLAELEQKNQEQDQRLTAIEAKDQEQDNKLAILETEQEEHAGKLTALESKNTEQDNRLTVIDAKDLEQDNNLTTLINNVKSTNERLNKMAREQYYVAKYFGNNSDLTKYVDYEKGGYLHKLELHGYTLPENALFNINIMRYKDGLLDGSHVTNGFIRARRVENDEYQQDHLFEMRTSSGDIKLYLTLRNKSSDDNTLVIRLYTTVEDVANYKIRLFGYEFKLEYLVKYGA